MPNKPSGGGSGGNKPSGGGSGGNKPSGGGNPSPAPSSPSKPSGGGSPSPAPSAPSKPSNPVIAAATQSGGGGGSNPSKPPSGGSSDKKVEKATQQIKQTISSINASNPTIADPKAYQKALDVLKNAGKDNKVQNLKEKVKTAKTTAQTDIRVNTAADLARKEGEANAAKLYEGSVTKEQLDKIIADLKTSGSDDGALSAEDLKAALDERTEDLMSKFDTLASSYKTATESLGTKEKETDATTAATTADSASASEDLNAQFEAFDPDLFSNLLGELESSKYRQKEWNERSAKAAYKY